MGKDIKIKHSLKALHGGTNVFGQIDGGMFYMVTDDQIMQGRG